MRVFNICPCGKELYFATQKLCTDCRIDKEHNSYQHKPSGRPKKYNKTKTGGIPKMIMHKCVICGTERLVRRILVEYGKCLRCKKCYLKRKFEMY